MRYACLIGLLGVALLASAISQASDLPDEPKAVKIYCPTVGLPDMKSPCGCKSGYCSLQPREGTAIEFKGAKLRFCCGACIKSFKEEPTKFAVPANHQLIATKQATQVKCPLCGGKADAKNIVNVNGVDIACCSAECAKKVADAPKAERATLVFSEQAFARGFVVNVAKK